MERASFFQRCTAMANQHHGEGTVLSATFGHGGEPMPCQGRSSRYVRSCQMTSRGGEPASRDVRPCRITLRARGTCFQRCTTMPREAHPALTDVPPCPTTSSGNSFRRMNNNSKKHTRRGLGAQPSLPEGGGEGG